MSRPDFWVIQTFNGLSYGALRFLLASGLSLMPDGLEKAVTVEQFADLIAFLRGWRDLK